MRRLLRPALFGLVLLAPSPFAAPGPLRAAAPPPPAATQPPAPPSFGVSVDVEVAEVQVFVTDSHGNAVSGLPPGDFRLEIDGEPRPVVNFFEARSAGDTPEPLSPAPANEQAAPVPAPTPAPPASAPAAQRLSLVVLLDELHIQPGERRRTLARLQPFLAERIAAGDRMLVATLDRSLRVRRGFDDTAPVAPLVAELEHGAPGGVHTETERRQALEQIRDLYTQQGCAALTEMNQVEQAWTSSVDADVRTTLDSLAGLLRQLAGRSGRKALLYVTSGLPLNPGLEARLLIAELCGGYVPPAVGLATAVAEVSRVANGAQVTLYTLDSGGQRVLASALDAGPGLALVDVAAVRGDLQDPVFAIAHDTGGRALLESNRPEALLADLTRDLSTYYSLGFAPRPGDEGRVHRISVTITRPGLRVRHRSAWEPLTAEQRLTARVLAALQLGGEETNPLQARVTAGEPRRRGDGSFDLPLVLEVPASALTLVPQGERRRGSLRVLLAVGDARGATTPVRSLPLPVDLPLEPAEATVPLRVDLRVRPGASTIVVAVRDEVGQETSVLRRQVTAGEAKR